MVLVVQELTSSYEGAIKQLPEVAQVVGLVSDINLGVASNPGLNHVKVCQAKLVQLLCQIPVGCIWLVICYRAKFTIWRQPGVQVESQMAGLECK